MAKSVVTVNKKGSTFMEKSSENNQEFYQVVAKAKVLNGELESIARDTLTNVYFLFQALVSLSFICISVYFLVGLNRADEYFLAKVIWLLVLLFAGIIIINNSLVRFINFNKNRQKAIVLKGQITEAIYQAEKSNV